MNVKYIVSMAVCVIELKVFKETVSGPNFKGES